MTSSLSSNSLTDEPQSTRRRSSPPEEEPGRAARPARRRSGGTWGRGAWGASWAAYPAHKFNIQAHSAAHNAFICSPCWQPGQPNEPTRDEALCVCACACVCVCARARVIGRMLEREKRSKLGIAPMGLTMFSSTRRVRGRRHSFHCVN